MLAALFLIGAALLGIGLARRALDSTIEAEEKVLWGFVLGWCIAALTAYGAARALGHLTITLVGLVTTAIWIATGLLWFPVLRNTIRHRSWQPSAGGFKRFLPLGLLLVLFAPIYISLFDSHMLRAAPDGGLYSGGESTSYDIAFHAAVTTSFVYGDNFPPIYTPMPPAPLLYPALPDFFTAILVVLGLDMHGALTWTAVPLALALTGLFYCFAIRLVRLGDAEKPTTEQRVAWAAVMATVLFLLNGGLGCIDFFRDWSASGKMLWNFLGSLPVNYSHIPAKEIVWPNLITDMLLPQRSSLFGLALAVIVLSVFAIAWKTGRDWKLLFGAGCVAGVLPSFHLHSYAAVGFVSIWLFLLKPQRVWLAFWLPAVVLALPHFDALGGHLAGTGLMRFQPGWRGNGNPNWLWFWVRNVGLPTLLIFPAWWSLSRSLRLFYLPFVTLLVLALLVVCSPNDYDNLKLMVYWHAATCVVIAVWLTRIGNRFAGRALVAVLLCGSIFSGVLAIIHEQQSSQRIFTHEEIAAAKFVTSNTNPHSLFLTAPSLLHPLLSLAGRSVVRGPTAWLWSHGYPFAEREADVRAIYAGRDDALELLRYYGVDYVYLGEREIRELRTDPAFFDLTFPLIYNADGVRIYDARSIADTGAKPGRLEPYPVREYAARTARDPSQFLTEFSSVAYRLYCLRRTAFDQTPRYETFMSELITLGTHVFPRGPGWRDTLAQNERALIARWMESSEVKERCARMSDGHETKEVALQRMATTLAADRGQFQAAFVLCHYFGYLKRDPDQFPDRDLTGYNHWRSQLARTGDYRGVTRAFIESDEYKRRSRN
jgi:hypothetical protein